MKFLFDNESFSFETLRAAGFANYGGAELGEVIVTARAIPEGDEACVASGMESHRRAGVRLWAFTVPGQAPEHQCP